MHGLAGRSMKKLRYLVEYLLVLPLMWIVDLLSLSAARRLVTVLADLWFRINPLRRGIATGNIIRSGVCADRGEASDIARRSYRQFALMILESLKSKELFALPGAEDRFRVILPPGVQRLLDDPKQGVILATGHFGSWEIAAQLISRIKPVAGVTRSMNNPYVDALMQRRKPRHRFHLVPKYDPGDVTRFARLLADGEALALMIDQHASARGVAVDFFGRPALTHTAIALLHLVTGAPLCFGYCLRTEEWSYELRAVGPLRFTPSGNKEADVRLVLESLHRELEKVIRETPDQYMWGHRRWKVGGS